MAEKKTKWTNADLKTGGPATEYGPWSLKDGRNYDEVIRGGGDTVEEILASARQFLAKPTVVGDIRSAERAGYQNQAAEAQRRAEEGSTLLGELKQHPIEAAKRGVLGASLPLSFAGGGIGAAASIPFALEAGSNLAEDPSLWNASMLALSAVPGAQWARQAPKAVAPAITQAQWARKLRPSQIAAKADQWTPQRPPPAPQFGGPQNIRNSGQRFPAAPVAPARSSMDALLQDTPDIPFEVLQDAPVAQGYGTMSEVDELVRGIPDIRSKRMATTSAPMRPSPDYVHPADRTGAMFGFDDLPEISEAELRALQQRWGGRK